MNNNKKRWLFTALLLSSILANAQTNPAITSWLQNTSGIKGRHYVSGNYTPFNDVDSANVQNVQYSTDWSYVKTKGIPGYITGPYLDGNMSVASDQNAIFKIPLNPAKNTGTPVGTTLGNIGVFINGVALFDYRDGVSWKNSTGTLCGGPVKPACMGDGIWNRDAVIGERAGFDCAKGHPAKGNYHHHQNPSAFKLDRKIISTVCNLYDADGLYVVDAAKHSPLVGFAYDGFPIYGAYGYKNIDGTGGIERIKSSYTLRSVAVRTHYADGTDVLDGPAVSTTYPLGYFREDYQFTAASQPDYLDEHNGRFCVTPEYPAGTYAYFCTVDDNWNSTYPYVVGPTFYGNKNVSTVSSITETTSTYKPGTGIAGSRLEKLSVTVFPNPVSDIIAIQFNDIITENINIDLYDINGRLVQQTMLRQGSTIAYFDTQTLYSGTYTIRFSTGKEMMSSKVTIIK